jgi:molecular chaperone GrpE
MEKNEDLEVTELEKETEAEPRAEQPVATETAAEEATTPVEKPRKSTRRRKRAGEVEQLKKEIAEMKDRYLRTLAEFDNFRKRSEREFQYLIQTANADLIKMLLPVVDDLERSLQAAKESQNFEALYKGIELVYQNFLKVLESFGVQPIEAVGKPFDPELHEALLQMESDHEPDTVVQEHQKGYRLHDRVLRPSKVIVSR